MSASLVKSTVENYFSPKYLFDPAHDLFRAIVSPEAHDTMEHPPWLSVATLLSYRDIADALAALPRVDDRIKAIVEALRDSADVELHEDVKGWNIRRKHFLRDDEDPALRSVFVRPVHPDSTDEEILHYFAPFGAIEEVNRKRTFGESDRLRASVVVLFVQQKDAEACASSTHSFGVLPVALGQRFVPKLSVMMLRAHEDHVREQNRSAEQKQLQANIVEAQRTLAAAKDGSTLFEAKKFLAPGRTMKVAGVARSTTWQEIKAKLGNLTLSRPALKGAVTLVTIEEAGVSPLFPERTAFVVVKTEAALEELQATYALADGAFMEEIKRICPNLTILSEQEDTWARKRFALWTEKRVAIKVDQNRKRDR